eukprot:CAMPEP_0168214210 /NCGR_PEP_ID=MMETSP0140_2-20121125/5227_1 /TAXON_ID=44445 /ORGANISM="Pseudo-nitzschia australis, Strain 10249 10 AB" /LENGTH=705 /DNA_ID=CAMNT_0008141153 /DNA_START=41 /DNA_END=2155 /DNA_ORIENTATION=-
MYIRNAQGQLMWVPPTQEFTPATQITRKQAIQNCIRKQLQREEWMRFNAPPPEDDLHFHDQNSYHDGSTISNNCHNNAVPVANSTLIANHGNILYRGQQPYNQMDPPIPRVIHSTPPTTYPITSPGNVDIGSNGMAPSYRNNVYRPPYNDTNAVEEGLIPDPGAYISCMSILFGSRIKSQRTNPSTRKTGFTAYDPLNISTSEVEIDDDLQSHSVRPRRSGKNNAFLCNGIRGPGKKFDYPCGKELNNFGSQNSLSSVVSESIEIENITSLKTRLKIIDSKDDLQVSANQTQHQSEDEENIQQSVYLNSPYEKIAISVAGSDDEKTKGLHSSEGVLSVHDSYEEHSYLIDSMSATNDEIQRNMNKLEDTGAVKVTDKFNEGFEKECEKSCLASVVEDHPQEEVKGQAVSYEEHSYLVDTMSVMNDEVQPIMNMLEGTGAVKLNDKFNGVFVDYEKSCLASVDEDDPQDEINGRANANRGDTTETTLTAREQTNVESSICEVCTEESVHEICSEQSVYAVCTEESIQKVCTEESIREVCTEQSVDAVCPEQSVNEICTEQNFDDVCTEQSFHEVCTEQSVHEVCTEHNVNKFCTERSVREICPEQSVHNVYTERIIADVRDFIADAYPSFDEPAEPCKIGEINANKLNTISPLTTSSSDAENRQVVANISPVTKKASPLSKPNVISHETSKIKVYRYADLVNNDTS